MTSFLARQSNSIFSAAILIGFFALMSRLLGVVRSRIYAEKFGAGIELDMFFAAFRIPDLVFAILIAGAVTSAFIPVFMEYSKRKRGEHWILASNVLNILGIGIAALSVLLAIFANQIIPIIAPGFTPDQQAVTVTLTRIMLLQPTLLAVSNVLSGILQAKNIFLSYSMAPMVYNLGIIFGALFFTDTFGVYGLAWGVVLGAIVHMAIQLPAVRLANFSWKPVVSLGEKGLQKVFRLMAPRTLGLASLQINIIVLTALASQLPEGNITIFNFANDLQFAPLGIVGIAFAIAAFPRLSQSFIDKDVEKYRIQFRDSISQLLFFLIPIAAMFLVLRSEVVTVIFKTHLFQGSDISLTAAVLAIFTVSIIFQGLIPLYSKAFYAIQNTALPVALNIVSVLANIALSIYMIQLFGTQNALVSSIANILNVTSISDIRILGLALAFSATSTLNFVLLASFFRMRIGKLPTMPLVLGKILLATVALGIVAQLSLNIAGIYFTEASILNSFITGTIAGIAGILVFLGVAWMLRIEELKRAIVYMRK